MKEIVPSIVPTQFNFDQAMDALVLAAANADIHGQIGLANDFRVAAEQLDIFRARRYNTVSDPTDLSYHPLWIQQIVHETINELETGNVYRGQLNGDNRPSWLDEI